MGAQRVQYLSWIIVGSSSSEGAVVEVEEAELSKAQKRRERQRANRAAAAQRKDLQREKIAKEQFLRETAQGFTERQMPLEPTASNCKERKSKPTQAKDFAENELGEDLLMQSLRDELRARAVPFFEGARNPLQTASRNAPQAVAQGAPYKPCSWCWKPALLDADCPHCPHCCCDPFSAGPGALPRDYGVEWEDAEVPGHEGETVDEAVDAGIEASIQEADAQAAAANAPLSAAILESRCSPTVYLLEFSRSPSSFLEALLNHPALQACADDLAAIVTDVWAEAGPPLLKSGAKMFVNPEQVPLVLEQIRAEGWQLKPRHVIVNDQYEEAVVFRLCRASALVIAVVQKRCSEMGAFGVRSEEALQSEWLSVVKRTFIHLPIPSSIWSGPSSGQKTASTSQAHVAVNPRQRKRPLMDPSSDCEDRQ